MTGVIPMHTSQPTMSPKNNRTTFLMCRPQYFDVAYEINPWMEGNINTVDNDLAQAQWKRLYDHIVEFADVKLIEPVAGLPDMVFTANAGVLFPNNLVWLAAFTSPYRQPEEEHFFKWFMANGYRVIRDYVDTGREHTKYAFEGAGDCLLDAQGSYWMAQGTRTTAEAFDRASRFFDKHEWYLVSLVDPRFYHLDTCFCPLSSGHILWFPPAFSEQSQALIRAKRGSWLIDVPEKDAEQFACNAVEPCYGHVIMPFVSKRLEKALDKAGYRVIQVDLSEFIKSGGAAKCLTMRV